MLKHSCHPFLPSVTQVVGSNASVHLRFEQERDFHICVFLKTNNRKTFKFTNFGRLQSQFHPIQIPKGTSCLKETRKFTVAKSVSVPAGAVFSGTCGSRSSCSRCLPSCMKRKLLLFKRVLAAHTFLVSVRKNWYVVFGSDWESPIVSYPQWKWWRVKSRLNRAGGTNVLVYFKCFPHFKSLGSSGQVMSVQ